MRALGHLACVPFWLYIFGQAAGESASPIEDDEEGEGGEGGGGEELGSMVKQEDEEANAKGAGPSALAPAIPQAAATDAAQPRKAIGSKI